MGRVRVTGAGSVWESRSLEGRCGFRMPAVYPPSASPATKHSFPTNRRDEALSFVTRENYRFHLMLRTRAILCLSRHLRGVLEKLTFPKDVIVKVDVDAYQLL